MAITRDQCQELLEKEVITKAEYNTLANMAEPLSAPAQSSSPSKLKKRKTAAFLAIFLGSIWAHKLYLQKINGAIVGAIFASSFSILVLTVFVASKITYTTIAQQMFWEPFFLFPAHIVIAVLSILLCINIVLGFIEGAIYFILSDIEFQELYVDGSRKWF